jgi:7-cyano-7-deazaguanine synthase
VPPDVPTPEPSAGRPAVVLLSGGLDSATVLAVATAEGFDCHALSFRYGQRHLVELDAAARVATAAGVRDHVTVDIDLGRFGGSALTSDDFDVPKHDSAGDLERDLAAGGVPVTYVPARNTVFLSYALAWAEVLGSDDVFIGVNALDYSGYPDCRPEYIAAYEHMANLATRAGTEGGRRLRIHTPLIDLTKAGIVELGTRLGVDLGLTLSCYDPTPAGAACGHCDSCLLRARGFREAGVPDPTTYAGDPPG